MDFASRPRQSGSLDRTIRMPNLGGIHSAQPARDTGRCRNWGPLAGPALRPQSADGPPIDRAPGKLASETPLTQLRELTCRIDHAARRTADRILLRLIMQ